MIGDTPEGWEPVDWIATNVCESIDGLLIGHDVFGEAWDDAGLESRRVFLCEVANFVREELEGAEVARLHAGPIVLAAVVKALEDPERPEESPVDAVRRLRAEVERLTEDETESVQDARHAMRLARIDRGVVEVEAARLRERVRAAESPARAQVIIAAWVRTGEPGNDISDPDGVCLQHVDLAAIHGTLDLDDWVADDETMTVSLRGEPGGES